MEISKEKFLSLPQVPGVYTFWKKNTPIYIGKSINLKSRLNSYLDLNLSPKTAQMVSEADNVTYIEVTSDLESLLLESYQIKKFKPKYNILLKDDKNALYIVITDEKLPRILTCRKIETVKYKNVFGPFPNTSNVKYILKLIRKIFPYSDHKSITNKVDKKPCLYSHIGLCDPCPNIITNHPDILVRQKLTARYINNIRNIKLVLSRKFNVVRKHLEKEMLFYSRETSFEKAKTLRDKIKTLDYVTQSKVDIHSFLENSNFIDNIREQELRSIKNVISQFGYMKFDIRRIECFDVAHLSGVGATASMVVFINGEKSSGDYRHFRINQRNKQSDYDSMREVVERRTKHFSDWGMPDLVIVDGGLGQVKIFSKKLNNLDICVVGIAKNPDRLIFPNGSKIKLIGPALHLISRIRDEAHRFARRYHHLLISKKLLN